MTVDIQDRYEKIARLVVERNLSVEKGDQVVIHTWDHTLDVAGKFFSAARRRRANPLISVTVEDEYFRTLRELDAKALRTKNTLAPAMARAENVDIYLSGPKDPTQFQSIPYEKIHAFWDEKLETSISAIHKRRKVRSAFVNIGQVTRERARAYGIGYTRWRDGMLDALTTPPETFARLARPLITALRNGKEGRIRSSGGSVLRFRLAGREPVLDDGVLRAEDLKRGDTFVHLPSGVVFAAPLEGSAEGSIEYDMPQPSRGRWVRGVWADVRNGKLSKFGASENEKELKNSSGTEAKGALLGYLTIGVNPRALPSFIDHQMAPGMIGVHFGNNEPFGGKIKHKPYHFGGFSRKATLEVDGKRLVSRGRLA